MKEFLCYSPIVFIGKLLCCGLNEEILASFILIEFLILKILEDLAVPKISQRPNAEIWTFIILENINRFIDL